MAVSRQSGGCIANATRIDAGKGRFFLKWGTGDVSRTFKAEAAGLAVLAEAASPLVVPRVLEVTDRFLLMEWIEPGNRPPDFWEHFGRGLALLHQFTHSSFGFEADNFIGKTPQRNMWKESWVDFFRACRLEPQVDLARSAGLWKSGWNEPLGRLCSRLIDWLPHHPSPSILHGDLWSGNFMVSEAGKAVLIDPAVYFGHAEADLAMTELFGGFDNRFYAAYEEISAIEAGYDERKELYNLYHLINHLNLFGASYAGGVERILKRYGV